MFENFPLDRSIFVSNSRTDSDLADTLLKAIHDLAMWPLQASKPSNATDKNAEKISSYIFVTRTIEDLVVEVEEMSGEASWDSRGRFLIVVADNMASAEQVALSVVQELWDTARIPYVMVLVQQDTLLNVYSWFPYTSHEQCDDVESVVLMNQWVMEGEGRFVRDVKLFPYKLPNNFHGCTLKVSTGFKDKDEDLMVRDFCKALNVTMEYVTDFPDNMSLYERVVASMQDLLLGKSDLSYGAIPLVEELATYADPSFPYYVLKYSWFVPCPKPFSRLQRISHIFSISVWVAIIIVLFVVAVTCWLLAKQTNDSHSYTTFSNALYNTWAVTVGVSVTEMPRSSRLKLTLLVLVWYCFAMSTVFQTFFTSFLVDPGFQEQLTTLEEILDSGIKFGYRRDFVKFYEESHDWRYKELVVRREECSPEDVCFRRIRETGDFATLAEEWYVQNFTNTINDHSSFCILNNNDYFFVFLSVYAQKGSFLLEFFNRIVTFATESGMVVKADRDRRIQKRNTPDEADRFGEYFVFTLNHLQIAFYILILGHSISFLLFVCEILYHSKLRKF
ncbi:hypothetical protein B7P43_G10647 [Cryptotermes secundus]|uniref:Ionotropic glutamate receptor C-terminal domain-containing protein n=1 Tax=Cryptotermes secundus TaxID=105785 RepID=A0A2J7QBD8_9NEOP|nr:hypothetical protein B7P43_G10647 [Cryptotermes secundus]